MIEYAPAEIPLTSFTFKINGLIYLVCSFVIRWGVVFDEFGGCRAIQDSN